MHAYYHYRRGLFVWFPLKINQDIGLEISGTKMSNRKRVRKVKCILFSFVTSFSVVIFLEECISYTKFLPVVFNEVDKK